MGMRIFVGSFRRFEVYRVYGGYKMWLGIEGYGDGCYMV